MYYQPHPSVGFKKFELNLKPMVMMPLIYPKELPNNNLVNKFKNFIGIKNPLDWYQESGEGNIDWNASNCGVDYKMIEQLLKPTMKDLAMTVINI